MCGAGEDSLICFLSVIGMGTIIYAIVWLIAWIVKDWSLQETPDWLLNQKQKEVKKSLNETQERHVRNADHIGAMTWAEFQAYQEKDKEISRRIFSTPEIGENMHAFTYDRDLEIWKGYHPQDNKGDN